MRKDELRLAIEGYRLELSNAALSNKREAIQRLIDAGSELGFAEAQEQIAEKLGGILRGEGEKT